MRFILRHCLGLAFFTVVTAVSCSKSERSVTQAESKPAEPAKSVADSPQLDACTLLSSEVIASVVGEGIKETIKLQDSEAGFHVSQCRFFLATAPHAINLRIVQKGPGADGRDPRQAWNETFAPEKLQDKKLQGAHRKWLPEAISGVGEKAFWREDGSGGALYVLKGNAYLRISIGGPHEKEEKIKKCLALANIVLKHL